MSSQALIKNLLILSPQIVTESGGNPTILKLEIQLLTGELLPAKFAISSLKWRTLGRRTETEFRPASDRCSTECQRASESIKIVNDPLDELETLLSREPSIHDAIIGDKSGLLEVIRANPDYRRSDYSGPRSIRPPRAWQKWA